MKIRPKEPKKRRKIVMLFTSFLFTSGPDKDLSGVAKLSSHLCSYCSRVGVTVHYPNKASFPAPGKGRGLRETGQCHTGACCEIGATVVKMGNARCPDFSA